MDEMPFLRASMRIKFYILLSFGLVIDISSAYSADATTCATSATVKYSDTFASIAEATGGQVQYMSPAGLKNFSLADDMIFLGNDSEENGIETGPATVLSLDKTISQAGETFSFPIDSSVSRLHIAFTITAPSRLTVIDPNGASIAPESEVRAVKQHDSGCFVGIQKPQAGTWKLAVSGSGVLSLRVKIRTPLRMNDFRYLETGHGMTVNESPHYFQPIAGESRSAYFKLFGDDLLQEGLALEVRTFAGEVLQSAAVTKRSQWTYFTEPFKVPLQPARAYVIGKNAAGETIERGYSHSIEGKTYAADDAVGVDQLGNSALQNAVFQNSASRVNQLLAAGADVNTQNIDGTTPLMSAVEHPDNRVLKKLLAAGADVNIESKYHGTALFKAVVAKNTEAVRLLLQKGARADIRDGSGYTALEWAEREHLEEIIELLKGVPNTAPEGPHFEQ